MIRVIQQPRSHHIYHGYYHWLVKETACLTFFKVKHISGYPYSKTKPLINFYLRKYLLLGTSPIYIVLLALSTAIYKLYGVYQKLISSDFLISAADLIPT